MSTPATPAPDAGTGTSTAIPGPRSTGTATGRTPSRGTSTPTSSAPTTGTRFAVVALVSVVLSVAASTSVVALTGVGDDAARPAPAVVVQPEQGVEEDASRELGDLADRRADSLCPVSAHPPVAC